MTDYFEGVEPKVGVNRGVTRRHLLDGLSLPEWIGASYRDGRRTMCGRNIMAYDPSDEHIPANLKGKDISEVPWCKACKRKMPVEPVDADAVLAEEKTKTPKIVSLADYRDRKAPVSEEGNKTCWNCGSAWFMANIALELDGTVSAYAHPLVCLQCGGEQA